MNFKEFQENEHLIENTRQAKQYVQQQKLSQKDFQTLKKIDPSSTGKYVGWMAKIWINEKPDINVLKNLIEEFDVLLRKGKTKTKDIHQFKTFAEFKDEIDELNNTGSNLSLKDLESDYDVILDTKKLFIAAPHTHEASRKLGLTHFSYRDCGDDEDSAWCTTYKTPSHFNSYYYSNNVTFYYIKVKGAKLIRKLQEAFPKRWKALIVTAVAVIENGKMEGYDGLNHQIKNNDIKTFTRIIGIK